MLYRRFERLIDPFRSASERMPPSEVLRFYVYFLRQVWPVFLALLVVLIGLITIIMSIKNWHWAQMVLVLCIFYRSFQR